MQGRISGMHAMSGKGSGRRPQQVPDEQVADTWSNIFGKKKPEKKDKKYETTERRTDSCAIPG